MKNIALTIVIVLGITLGGFAQQNGGGLFNRGAQNEQTRFGSPVMPNGHDWNSDANGQTGAPVPLGSGVAMLLGLGAAYLVGKRRMEE